MSGVDITDVVVGNGTVSNFVSVDDNTYTVLITADGSGDVTIDVAAGVAQDDAGNGNLIATQAITLFVPPVFTVDAISDLDVAENVSYTSVMPNLSGDAPIGTVVYTLGGADAGLFTIDPATGVASLVAQDFETPLDANGDNGYEVTVVATDDDGNTDSESWIVSITDVVEGGDTEAVYTVNGSLPIESYSDGELVGSVTDVDGAIVSAEVTTGTLPPGTEIDPVTGAITVTDTSLLEVGSYILEVTTTDVDGGVTVQEITIDFSTPGTDIEAVYTVVTPNPVDSYSNGDIVGSVLDADGTIVGAVLSNSTVLPTGVSLDPISGELTVSDVSQLVVGVYTFEVTTTDINGETTVSIVSIEFTTAGSDIESVYTVNDSRSTDTYSNGEIVGSVLDADTIASAVVTSGSLPDGITMDPLTGLITVSDSTILTSGSYTFEVTTTDLDGGTTVHVLTIDLTSPGTDTESVYTVTPGETVDSYTNGEVLASVVDLDGGVVSAEVTTGTLPPGTSIDPITGEITVTDSTLLVAGEYTFDVTTVDGEGNETVHTLTISLDVSNPDIEANYTVSAAQIINDFVIGETLAEVTDVDGGVIDAVVTSGVLPMGTEINSTTGVITVLDETLLIDGTYTFEVTTTDSIGGITVNEVTLVFESNPEVALNPQLGFTPNTGIDGFWVIEGIENYPDNSVYIFNRWGNEVFNIKGYDNADKAWFGENEGKLSLSESDVPDGTYFYLIDLGDGGSPVSGYVIIKR